MRVPHQDCWLHPDVEVRHSPIAGRGLFSTAVITGGTVVSRLGGRLVSTEQLQELFAAAGRDALRPYVDTIGVAEDVHLVLPPRRPNGFGNHSCEPNLWWVGPYELAARRDIAPGEELVNDYATSTGEPGFVLECSCGSASCRRVVTGDDWRLPELRERYGGHWIPLLLARIREVYGSVA